MPTIPIIEVLTSLLVTIFAAAFGYKMSDELDFNSGRRKRRTQLKADLLGAIHKGVTTWDELSLLVQYSELNRAEVRFTLLETYRECIAEEDGDKNIRDAVKSLIAQADKNEPFADIPPTIAVRLDTLLTAAPERDADIRLLASAISDVVLRAGRDQRRQKLLNYVGFAVGLLGLVVGVVGLVATVKPSILTTLHLAAPAQSQPATPALPSTPAPASDHGKEPTK